MKRSLMFTCLAAVSCGLIGGAARHATSAGGQGAALVRLQGNSPGLAQAGHANLTGTVIAGNFQGSGSGLTGVPWTSITGAPSTLLTLPYSIDLGTSLRGTVFSITNGPIGEQDNSVLIQASSGRLGAVAVKGISSFGGIGVSGSSDTGSGVFGETTSSSPIWNGSGVTGVTHFGIGSSGVHGYTDPTGGFAGLMIGVRGDASTPGGIGVQGTSIGNTGIGVKGLAVGNTQNYGGWFETDSTFGYGLRGVATATSGITYGVHGLVNSPSGRAVQGSSTHTAGAGYGGYFQSDGTSGTGVFGIATAGSGSTSRRWAAAAAPARPRTAWTASTCT